MEQVFGYSGMVLKLIGPLEQCDVYGSCGAFSICNQKNVCLCGCLQRFEPQVPKDWKLQDHKWLCEDNSFTMQWCEKFLISCIAWCSQSYASESSTVKDVDECKLAWLRNCSCTAFAYDYQCLIWKGDLFNLKQLASAGKRGQDWHVRVAGSEKDQIIYSANKKKRETAWIFIWVLAGLFFVLSVVMVIFRRKQSVGALDTVEDSLVLFKYRDLKNTNL